MALVIDIETVGLPPESLPERALAYLYRSLSRDGATEGEIDARREEMVSRFSLDPTTGAVICIGLLDTESGEEKAVYGTDEREVLTSFWRVLEERRPERFVTFNGKSFDFPFINIRSAVLEVAPSRTLPLEPHATYPHFDVREVLAGYERHRRGNLDYFCAIFGIASPKVDLDGAAVGQAFRERRLDEIALYCLADCRATASLYERLAPFF